MGHPSELHHHDSDGDIAVLLEEINDMKREMLEVAAEMLGAMPCDKVQTARRVWSYRLINLAGKH